MSKMSLLDKLRILADLSASSKVYVMILVILLIFGFILSDTTKKNERMHKLLFVGMTAVIAGLLIVTYHSSLGNMFSYMMKNFFIAFYFPTIAIYLAAIIAMNIIVWISIFSFKSSKQIKLLNISIYIIMNYLMALLLKVINTNKLDIFDQASLYGNKNATALIELSSLVFIVWIVFLILYKVILIYLKKDYKPKVKRVIIRKKVKKLPENFESKLVPEYVYGNAPHQEPILVETPKTEDEILLEHYSKLFTLEDYKLFAKLLKQEQEKEKNKKIDFISQEKHEKMKKTNKKKKEVVVPAANTLEEDSYREQQKQVIIQMEEERKRLLEEEKKKQQQEISLSQPVVTEEEREQRKLTELEMLYQ